MQVAHVLRTARRRSGLSARALAERAGTSHATVLAYESGRKVPRADTLLRLLRAAGFEPTIELGVPADTGPAGRVAKGVELVEALELAEQFPARHHDTITFPPFGRAA